jgi:hypothetical protein
MPTLRIPHHAPIQGSTLMYKKSQKYKIQTHDLILHQKQIMHIDYNQIINLKIVHYAQEAKNTDDILELLQFVGFHLLNLSC